MLPFVDETFQRAYLFLQRVPIEVEVLRSKIETKRKATNLKMLRLQEDLGKCHYDTEILKNEIRKKDQKYNL